MFSCVFSRYVSAVACPIQTAYICLLVLTGVLTSQQTSAQQPSQEPKRIAIPNAELQASNNSLIADAFPAEGNRGKSIVAFIKNEEADTALRYSLLIELQKQASHDGDAATWLFASRELVKTYEINREEFLTEGLLTFAQLHPQEFLASELYTDAMKTCDSLDSQTRFDQAISFLQGIKSATANEPRNKRAITERLDRLVELQQLHSQAVKFQEAIANHDLSLGVHFFQRFGWSYVTKIGTKLYANLPNAVMPNIEKPRPWG